MLHRDQKRYEEPEKLLAEASNGRQVKLGPQHPQTLESMHDIAVLYMQQTRHDDGEPLLIQAVEGRRTTYYNGGNYGKRIFGFILFLKNILSFAILTSDTISTASHYDGCISKQDAILPVSLFEDTCYFALNPFSLELRHKKV